MALDLIIITVAAVTGGWLFGEPFYDLSSMLMGLVLGGWVGFMVVFIFGFMNM